jgi:putative transcriptional regulator
VGWSFHNLDSYTPLAYTLCIEKHNILTAMVIIETSVFTRQVRELLTDDEYRELQAALVVRPDIGSVIVGSGGLRKVRWRGLGRGVSVNEELFEELVASVREGGAILRGKVPPSRRFIVEGPDVQRIRANYKLSQSEFAALLGISVATLRNWEQGRRSPNGPARVLLQVAAKHPDAVWDVIRPVIRREQKRTAGKTGRTGKAA